MLDSLLRGPLHELFDYRQTVPSRCLVPSLPRYLVPSLPRCLVPSLPFSLCAAHAVSMRMASSTVCAQVKDVSGSGNNWAQGHIEYGEREHRGERVA